MVLSMACMLPTKKARANTRNNMLISACMLLTIAFVLVAKKGMC